MVLAVHAELVSRVRAFCGRCDDALHKVNLSRLERPEGEWRCLSRPPLARHAPCARLLLHNHRDTPRDRPLAGGLCHSPALGALTSGDTSTTCTSTKGAQAGFERSRPIIHHINPPPARGAFIPVPFLALTLSLASCCYAQAAAATKAADAAAWRAEGGQQLPQSWQPRPAGSGGRYTAKAAAARPSEGA